MLELPDNLLHIWYMFIDLRRRGTHSGFGVSNILWSEISAYKDVKSLELEEEEVDVICMLDDIAVDILSKHQAKENKTNKGKS